VTLQLLSGYLHARLTGGSSPQRALAYTQDGRAAGIARDLHALLVEESF
jgi:hypothetical protein